MWQFVGLLLILYSIVALIVLYLWWRRILAFVYKLLVDAEDSVQEADKLLPPLQAVAQDARQMAISVHGVGTEVTRVVPPALSSIALALGDLSTSITDFRASADSQLEEIGTLLKESLETLVAMLTDQATLTFPAVTAILRAFAASIDELEYRVTAEVLQNLVDNLGVPQSVADKLVDLIDRQFENRAAIDDAIRVRLRAAISAKREAGSGPPACVTTVREQTAPHLYAGGVR